MAVQQENNEAAISAIAALSESSQKDLKFFIEDTMGQLARDAIADGVFTSGQLWCHSPPLCTHANAYAYASSLTHVYT